MRSVYANLAAVFIGFAICLLPWAGRADQDVPFKVTNDTNATMTALYDKLPSAGDWGSWNNLQDFGSADPWSGKVHPVPPGHSYTIHYVDKSGDPNSQHCPTMLMDVKAVFSNGDVRIIRSINVCRYDWDIKP